MKLDSEDRRELLKTNFAHLPVVFALEHGHFDLFAEPLLRTFVVSVALGTFLQPQFDSSGSLVYRVCNRSLSPRTQDNNSTV